MFKVCLLQSLAWLYHPLISLLLQVVAQVSLFKSGCRTGPEPDP